MKMTDPVQAVRFVQETKIDLLAVTIGNVHGKYAMNPPQLDFTRLQQIRHNLHTQRLFPHLVLHGASGLPHDLIQQCIHHEVVKFNVNTDLRTSALTFLKKTLETNPKVSLLNNENT